MLHHIPKLSILLTSLDDSGRTVSDIASAQLIATETSCSLKSKTRCGVGVAEATATTVVTEAVSVGIGVCVTSGIVTGLDDLAVDTEPTTFVRPTVIVQT